METLNIHGAVIDPFSQQTFWHAKAGKAWVQLITLMVAIEHDGSPAWLKRTLE